MSSQGLSSQDLPPVPVVFIPALLCDEALYRVVIAGLGAAIMAHVMLSPRPRLEDSAADILALEATLKRAHGTFGRLDVVVNTPRFEPAGRSGGDRPGGAEFGGCG